jgi:arylsulfatase A-like enzyme
VIFTSDNGGLSTAEGSPTCNSPLSEGKGWMYDGGVREPLIIKWPGVIQSGSVCEVAVTSPDFYPTLLELAGLSLLPEQHYDGISIAPLLYGEESIDREAIYWHYPHYGNQGGTPGSAIRRGDHKLIEFFEDGRLELYNLREDISETKNLVTAEPQLAAEMHRMLVSWRNSIEALMPQPRKDQA